MCVFMCVHVCSCVCVSRNKMVDGVFRRAAALPPVTSATLPQSCDPAGKQRREWLLFVRSLRLCVCVCVCVLVGSRHTHTHTHTHTHNLLLCTQFSFKVELFESVVSFYFSFFSQIRNQTVETVKFLLNTSQLK